MRILSPRTFPPLNKVERRHAPTPAAGRYGYRAYRSCLRWEFGFTCAFCLLHEADLSEHGIEGTGLTGVEHFLPISKEGAKANEYRNCFYACRFCNEARSDASAVSAGGRKLLNPCDHAWGAHFQLSQDDRLLPRPGDADAAYTEVIYDLNDLRKVRMRRWRREHLEELLDVLREAPAAARELADLSSELPTLQREALRRAAQRLLNEARRALRDLERFAAIPRDAAMSCQCRRTGCYLPSYLAAQTREMADLVTQDAFSERDFG